MKLGMRNTKTCFAAAEAEERDGIEILPLARDLRAVISRRACSMSHLGGVWSRGIMESGLGKKSQALRGRFRAHICGKKTLMEI